MTYKNTSALETQNGQGLLEKLEGVTDQLWSKLANGVEVIDREKGTDLKS